MLPTSAKGSRREGKINRGDVQSWGAAAGQWGMCMSGQKQAQQRRQRGGSPPFAPSPKPTRRLSGMAVAKTARLGDQRMGGSQWVGGKGGRGEGARAQRAGEAQRAGGRRRGQGGAGGPLGLPFSCSCELRPDCAQGCSCADMRVGAQWEAAALYRKRADNNPCRDDCASAAGENSLQVTAP